MIDLTALTDSERRMLDENKNVLTEGTNKAALYLRYSSDRQSEQSIEGQLRDCIAYCLQQDYRITVIYVDRSVSAKSADKRTEFLRMISDSEKRHFDFVIVWKLDRFARNRNDSAIYKMRLKRNGIRIVSVTENISDNPEGIILESVLEGMAEFYSAELSQKISRGMRESALKCNSIGGQVPLGYKIEDHKFVVDPVGAAIVRKAFELYAQGWTVADICREFNLRGYRTSKNAEFNRNSFKSMLRNKRYIGVYKYRDIEIEDGFPAIVDKDLFREVQLRLAKNGEAPARGKAKVEYLLSGKLFCGHCGEPMNGDCGTGKSGKRHYYYSCRGRKIRGNCLKKSLRKEVIEEWVVRDAYELLTKELIEEIADIAIQQSEADIAKHTKIPVLTNRLTEIDKSILNIVSAIEKGVASETLMQRLSQLESEKCDVNKQLSIEKCDVVELDRDMVIFWLERFADGNIQDKKFRRQLIDLLINRVTVWDTPDGDYKVEIAYNLTSHPSKTISGFGYKDSSSTIPRKSELLVVGTLCVQTKIHSLP